MEEFLKLLSKIADGLRAQPVLLAAFALSLIVFFFCWSRPEPTDPSLRIYPLIGNYVAMLLVVALAGLMIVRFTCQPTIAQREPPQMEQQRTVLPQLGEVSENFEKAKQLIPGNVLKEIEYEIATVVDHSRDWKDGEISPQAERYDNMLKDAYEEATKMVFSTSVKEYLETWDSP